MSAWLHFIGKQYYYMSRFIKEAQSAGISRRVSLQVLKQMQWGDQVGCAQSEPGLKSPSVFLEFRIETITGLSRAVHRDIMEKFPCRVVDLGGQRISRGCGEYITGISIETHASIEDVVSVIEAHNGYEDSEQEGIAGDASKSQPMIGCGAESVRLLGKPFPILRDVPFEQGFRLYDRALLMKAIDFAGKGNRARVRGQLHVNDKTESQEGYGEVQEVMNYTRK